MPSLVRGECPILVHNKRHSSRRFENKRKVCIAAMANFSVSDFSEFSLARDDSSLDPTEAAFIISYSSRNSTMMEVKAKAM